MLKAMLQIKQILVTLLYCLNQNSTSRTFERGCVFLLSFWLWAAGEGERSRALYLTGIYGVSTFHVSSSRPPGETPLLSVAIKFSPTPLLRVTMLACGLPRVPPLPHPTEGLTWSKWLVPRLGSGLGSACGRWPPEGQWGALRATAASARETPLVTSAPSPAFASLRSQESLKVVPEPTCPCDSVKFCAR